MAMSKVAVLFARVDSIYKTFPDCDVYDINRNALTWPGGYPVVAHPPCRTCGKLRQFSKAPASEHELAVWATEQVKCWGGVLEHPEGSKLWSYLGLPPPLIVDQFHWGHKARKRTWLYIVGVDPGTLDVPFRSGEPTHTIGSSLRISGKPDLPKRERDVTPIAFAQWLVELAKSSNGGSQRSE